jgi:hypothetical protein
MIEAPISVGELFDKITILQIKIDHGILEAQKELEELETKVPSNLPNPVFAAVKILRSINEACWDIEDGKREHERNRDFNDDFIVLARCVYMFNDERAKIKKIINELSGSSIIEYKSHKEY